MGENVLLGVRKAGAAALPQSGKDDGFVTSKVIIALLLIAEESGNDSTSDFENSAKR